MTSTFRQCPSCKAGLPADAIFCHKCGAATPLTQDPALEATLDDAAEVAQRAAVQRALGETYTVRRLLGRGGFAEVWVAYDKRLKREIAVKTIRSDLVVNETLLERFQREAEAVAKLRHPNVIPIYSVGEERGLAFFTMPLVEGDSLATALGHETRFPVSESIRILREAANALHAAHRVGIVHRDIKPENIMLEGPERTTVVMDFGIAKNDGSDEKGLTGTGMLVGTPDYMSPEQATGDRTLDARTDQYSLAMVGYRMLTGRVPFEGSSLQTLIFRTVTEVPAPANEIASDVPVALSDVLAKALAKKPDDRFESMAAFAAALTRVEQAAQGSMVSRERRLADRATRLREMHAAMPTVRRFVAAAVVGIIATTILLVVGSPRVPFAVAPMRDDAVFAAKTFLASHAGTARRSEFTSFVSDDSVYRFLRTSLGRDSAEQRAATDMPTWKWTIRSLSPVDRSEWRVTVGPSGKPIGFWMTIADSVTRPRIPIDSARALATKELTALGYDAGRLRAISDSTIGRKARTDYLLRFAQNTAPVRWKNDSAYARVSVTIAGDRVSRVDPRVRVPDAYRDRNAEGMVGALFVVFLVGALAAIIVVMRRQPVDELQWSTMTRLFLFALAITLVELIVGLPETIAERQVGVGQPFSQMLILAIGLGLAATATVCILVAGESLVYKHLPAISAGLRDIMRGRLSTPELVTSVGVAYGCGAALAVARALVVFVTETRGMGAPMVPWLPFGGVPFFDVLTTSLAAGFGLTIASLFVLGVALSIRFVSRAAVVLPAILTGAAYALGGVSAATTLAAIITILIVTLAMWRYGILAAVLTATFAIQIEGLIPLMRAGDPHDLLHGIALAVCLLVPAMLALVAYRRLSAPSHGSTPITTRPVPATGDGGTPV